MFADPAVVTIDGSAKSLVRVSSDKYSSEYMLRTETSELRLTIRNSTYTDKRRQAVIDRHNVEIIETVFPVAPALTSSQRKAYVVIENQRGDSLTAPREVAFGLLSFLTEAKIDQLFNFES